MGHYPRTQTTQPADEASDIVSAVLICVTTTLLRARSTTRTFAFDLDAYLAYTLAEQPALIAWRPHTSVMGS